MGGGVTEVHQGSLPGVRSTVGQHRGGLGRRATAAPCPPCSSCGEAKLHVRLGVSSLHFVFSFLQHRRLQGQGFFTQKLSSAWGEDRKNKACTAKVKGRHDTVVLVLRFTIEVQQLYQRYRE